MQLSCLPVSFFAEILNHRMSVAEWARMGAEAGFDAIDLSILFLPERTLRAAAALRQAVEVSGMRVAMLCSYPDFTHPDPAHRRRELALAQENVALAAELGARLLRVTAGQAHPETGRDEGIAWAIEGLRELAKTATGSPVTLVYENHAKPGAWAYTDFSQPPDIFLEIALASVDTGLRVNYDTANATAFSDDPLALLDQVLPWVTSIHVSDTAVYGQLQPVLVGTGVTPLPAIFQRLVWHAWDGWLCIEEASFKGRAGVEAAGRFVRQAWREAQTGRAELREPMKGEGN